MKGNPCRYCGTLIESYDRKPLNVCLREHLKQFHPKEWEKFEQNMHSVNQKFISAVTDVREDRRIVGRAWWNEMRKSLTK